MPSNTPSFQIATWYDTWNKTGLQNLVNLTVPLNYASRYNLAFASLVAADSAGYTIQMTGQYADQVKAQLATQAPRHVHVGREVDAARVRRPPEDRLAGHEPRECAGAISVEQARHRKVAAGGEEPVGIAQRLAGRRERRIGVVAEEGDGELHGAMPSWR